MVDVINAPEETQALVASARSDPSAAVEQIVATAQSAAVETPPERVVAYETAQRQLRQLLDQTEG